MSEWLWALEDLIAAMAAEPRGALPLGINGVSIDTRSLEIGDAYFAIKGDVHDGHKFVAAAFKSGAALSVVSHEKLNQLEGDTGPLLVVNDVLKAMEALGRASRVRSNAQIIAITGSVGKTTTKEALRLALSACGKVHASAASYNNHWGVPLTLARMPVDVEYGIFEIGMNHPGEISTLARMVRPHVAAIMNVAAVHLGAFRDVDEIALAKAEIFEALTKNGTAVLNADDDRLPILLERAKQNGVKNIVLFGEAKGADVHIDKLVLHGSCSCLTANVIGTPMVVKVGAPGRHIVQNIAGVLAIVKLVDADLARAGLALANMEAVKGRGQQVLLDHPDGQLKLIDESYNANPTSMTAALNLLGASQPKGAGRRVAVLGDMMELGETSGQLHASLAHAVLNNKIDRVYLAGNEMKSLADALKGEVECVHADGIEALAPKVISELRGGDVVMAKASLGMKFAVLIEELKRTWNSV